MADKLEVNAIGKSEAEVAMHLFKLIADVEGRALYKDGSNPADRDYIIKTFAQCMWTVKSPNYNL